MQVLVQYCFGEEIDNPILILCWIPCIWIDIDCCVICLFITSTRPFALKLFDKKNSVNSTSGECIIIFLEVDTDRNRYHIKQNEHY